VVEQSCSGHLVHDNGFACVEGDLNSFYEATSKLVQDSALRRQLGANSRALAVTLEKRAVVQQMLDHYSTVTDQFYRDYGGRHVNRDAAFRHQYSFVGGSHPRPLLLVAVEYVFVVLFQVMWNMSSLFFYVQAELLSRAHVLLPQPDHRTPLKSPNVAEPQSRGQSVVVAVPNRLNFEAARVGSHQACSGDEESGFADQAFLKPDSDDDTVTTSSANSVEVALASSSSCLSPLSCIPGNGKSCPDCQLSHTIAKSFVAVMQFQMRAESNVRSLASSFVSAVLRHGSSPSVGSGASKRKNSSVIAVPANGTTTIVFTGSNDESLFVPPQRVRCSEAGLDDCVFDALRSSSDSSSSVSSDVWNPRHRRGQPYQTPGRVASSHEMIV
jgi:hypothetical protein